MSYSIVAALESDGARFDDIAILNREFARTEGGRRLRAAERGAGMIFAGPGGAMGFRDADGSERLDGVEVGGWMGTSEIDVLARRLAEGRLVLRFSCRPGGEERIEILPGRFQEIGLR